MPKILFCGKGGSGKSTLLSLLALHLSETRDVVVIDTDESNTGLARMMGLDPPGQTLMDFLGGKDSVRRKMGPRGAPGESRAFFPAAGVAGGSFPGVCESARGRIRLASVGKIEHAHEGCACPMGVLARDVLGNVPAGADRWVLVDTEAGIEHIGRGLLEGMNAVVVVVEPSHDAVALAGKIVKLAAGEGRRCLAVLNRVADGTESLLKEALARVGIETAATLANSQAVAKANLLARPLALEPFRKEIGKLAEALER
ncbi:MAG: zeta toxin family protein [Pseudomonadota bacterium]|jgi:CO dehydrogenase maturation factor|nr:nitrogenase reductase [Syntrophaceae bacterium]MDI9556421.1 zeta toxin family protein [Pseudomonadota bacterium]NLX31629.1 nitrogenase reductase [Deltaproteobacteria bacterium]HNU84969.1 zeta toxin family protein [Syntrophales bacterium]HNZ34994.1 zeta toxin family protein [Syntrophales bacterium]